EDKCFSCGVVECPQRPWVKQPHAALDLGRARAVVAAETAFGRKGRRAAALAVSPRTARHAGIGLGLATSTRFRIVFHKGSEMRFTSHLDLMRTWERTLRRSQLPLAFTQ